MRNKHPHSIESQSMRKNPTEPSLTIGKPLSSQITELRKLWKDTFGDSDAFLDTFQETAFSLDRCHCITLDEQVVAALYWFDCSLKNKKIAYIYAVATDKNHRKQGLCHALMEHTHKDLKETGYEGAILSPASEELIHFYEKIGYETCAYIDELSFDDNTLIAYGKDINIRNENLFFRKISKDEFAKLRRELLPKDALVQENENLDFLETQAEFYAGNGFLLTAQMEDNFLNGIEFLGDTALIPAIIQSFSCTHGTFRTIGMNKPFGMYYSLTDSGLKPGYLGFAFD